MAPAVPDTSLRSAGRVGGLAAALGIGAAILACAGGAWAQPSSPDSSSDAAGPRSKVVGADRVSAHTGGARGQRGRRTSATTPGASRSERPIRPSTPVRNAAREDPIPPTVTVNGLTAVATTPLTVTSFYGKFSTGPSTAGSVQGRQQFDLVDQKTGDVVGKFSALVSQNNSFGIVTHRRVHTELLVTDVEEGTVGTGPGQVPPPQSRIGWGAIRDSAFGSVYSAMPEPGGSVVRWKLLTPFGDLPLPPFYDATKGFADYARINEPFSLANGYSVGPADPGKPWITTAIAGISPLYTVEQGTQKFRVYDTATGVTTGSFTGYATPTLDALFAHTLAIVVTDSDGSTDVGTAAGRTPPPGTVYNVMYIRNLRPHLFYSSMPTASGDVTATRLVTPWGSVRLPIRFNASTPPAPAVLRVPGGYTFVPTSALQRSGLNGLPPFQVLFQGYQQFDVLDPDGNTIGSVDADVSHQWNGLDPRTLFGLQSTGILITKITAGTSGTGPADVPPVGSVYNFLQSKTPGFGRVYSAVPSPARPVITDMLVTPFGSLPVPTWYDATAGLAGVRYVDPFAA